MAFDHLLQEIKGCADIAEITGYFLPLRRAGSRLRSLCPFHEERTPSFYVTPSKGIFKCFGCGKGGDAIHFLMEYQKMSYPDAVSWLANFYGISSDGTNGNHCNKPPRRIEPQPNKPQLPPSFVDAAIFQRSLAGYESNNLVQWLCRKIGRSVVLDAVKAYHVGTAQNGRTIFWQVNIEGRAGSGHVIAYPPNDHHRIKSIAPTWAHSLLRLTDEGRYNWLKYWFGEHLLAQHPTRKVAIVESEKTALVASIYLAYLDFVWLASCGKDGLNNRDKWKVLQGRTVTLYPDLSLPDERGQTPFQHWTAIAAEMQTCGYDVSVNNFLETRADEFERAHKWDLADFLLCREFSEFQQAKPATTILPPGYRRERFTDRETRLSFEVLLNGDGYPATWDLQEGQRETPPGMIQVNPAVTELIDRFDLRVDNVKSPRL